MKERKDLCAIEWEWPMGKVFPNEGLEDLCLERRGKRVISRAPRPVGDHERVRSFKLGQKRKGGRGKKKECTDAVGV